MLPLLSELYGEHWNELASRSAATAEPSTTHVYVGQLPATLVARWQFKGVAVSEQPSVPKPGNDRDCVHTVAAGGTEMVLRSIR